MLYNYLFDKRKNDAKYFREGFVSLLRVLLENLNNPIENHEK